MLATLCGPAGADGILRPRGAGGAWVAKRGRHATLQIASYDARPDADGGCGIGSWGGQRLRMAPYVRGMRAQGRGDCRRRSFLLPVLQTLSTIISFWHTKSRTLAHSKIHVFPRLRGRGFLTPRFPGPDATAQEACGQRAAIPRYAPLAP